MARTRRRAAPTAELIAALFAAVDDAPVAVELGAWLDESPAFRRFVDAHRDKVRKKLRTAPDAEARRDVRLELLVARRLCAARSVELAFEPYGARGGPDFRVAMPGHPPFNLEVTRLRGAIGPGRLASQILAKLRQLPPSVANALLVAGSFGGTDLPDLGSAIRELRARADPQDEAFLAARGLASSREFSRRFQRLSAVLLADDSAPSGSAAELWVNPAARIALPPRAARAVLDLVRA